MFQNVRNQILNSIPWAYCYIDDILAKATSAVEHLHRLGTILERLERHGTRTKHVKCSFLMSVAEYLGHKVDDIETHPLADRNWECQGSRNCNRVETDFRPNQLLG